MNENALLMLSGGGKKIPAGSIGTAGEQGFGVGVYPGDTSDLTAIGLSPMQGFKNPSSPNYGNYVHSNGSIMVFIPAFCFRTGYSTAPSYSRDGENAVEIRDASLGEGNGWKLHRAFIDGGSIKSGFFIDKYFCSKDTSGKLAVSVKDADTISLSSKHTNSSSMPECTGHFTDAITLSRARGSAYSVVTSFQWGAVSLLSLAHGQAATSSKFCGWYDPDYSTNFPKCNNTTQLNDISDKEVTWKADSSIQYVGKTGSGSPFNKTTHNGQECGITDVGGLKHQITIGVKQSKSMSPWYYFRESVSAHSVTASNYSDESLYGWVTHIVPNGNYYWGPADAFSTSHELIGVVPRMTYANGIPLFGYDSFKPYLTENSILTVGGAYGDELQAGIWARRFNIGNSAGFNFGFRASGYAK